MELHQVLDWQYGADGADVLRGLLRAGADVNGRVGHLHETALHVAARRRRCDAIEILVEFGADLDARTVGGQTAFSHASRRTFGDVADLLGSLGADTALTYADEFAVAVLDGHLEEARILLGKHPTVARTGDPENDPPTR